MDRPTIAHITRTYYRLTENWIHTQISQLRRYRPLVLTWRTANLGNGVAAEVYGLLERPPWETLLNRVLRRFVGYYPSFYRRIRSQGAVGIHAHFGPCGWFALPLKRAAGLPLITSFYGYDASRLPGREAGWRLRYHDLFTHGDLFLVEGPNMGRQLVELGCPDWKVVLHRLGVEVDRFPFKTRCLAEGEPLRILMAGRFTEKKGIVYGVEAFARMVGDGVLARLTIFGDATPADRESQTAKERIVRAIEGSGVGHLIALMGTRPHAELTKAYYEHHVFLSPSVQARDGDNEGGAPVTLLEAQCTGMPVVGTLHCDVPEVVVHGRTGLLAPEGHVDTLAAYLVSLCSQPERLLEMGAAASQHIRAKHDARTQAARLEEIYDSISREGSQP